MPMTALTLKQVFQGLHKSIRFYACFEVLQESGIKYLLADSAAKGEPEFLYTFAVVFWKGFFLVGQYLHCAVCDINQVATYLSDGSSHPLFLQNSPMGGSGFWILMRRLDRDVFHWSGTPDEFRWVTLKEMHWLCDGLFLNQKDAFEEHRPKIAL